MGVMRIIRASFREVGQGSQVFDGSSSIGWGGPGGGGARNVSRFRLASGVVELGLRRSREYCLSWPACYLVGWGIFEQIAGQYRVGHAVVTFSSTGLAGVDHPLVATDSWR
jgi:hypothetical protein